MDLVIIFDGVHCEKIVQRGICYDVSLSLSVCHTTESRYKDIDVLFAPYDRAMFLVRWEQILWS